MKRISKLGFTIKNFVVLHKALSVVVILALAGASFYTYKVVNRDDSQIKYFFTRVKSGDLSISVSGTGQVSSLTQMDIKPKTGGDIVYLGVSNGQYVRAGALIAQIDASGAEKVVRDAEVSLESAQIALEKLRGPDYLSIARNKEQAEQDLSHAYDDGFNVVSNAFLKLPTVMTGLQNILLGNDLALGGGGQSNLDYITDSIKVFDESVVKYKDDALDKYQLARKEYDQNFLDYKAISRFDSSLKTESIIDQTYNTTKTIAEAVKSASNLLQFHSDKLAEHNLKQQSSVTTFLLSLSSYTGDTNTYLLNLLNTRNTIKSAKDAILNSDLDLRSQQLTVKQRENTLADAKEQLQDYYIRAPFDGTMASISVKKFDSVSSGTVVAKLLTKKKIANISLNEIDVSKIKVGQDVILSFDAIDDFSVKGKVSEIDSIGAVSQGVVSYNVQIAFESDDIRIKSGMSVSASITTEIKKNTLILPSVAIKNRGNISYVEVFRQDVDDKLIRQGYSTEEAPSPLNVDVGLSNDTETEILGGLEVGQQVILRTSNINTAGSQIRTNTPSLFGGGSVRVR